MKKLFLTGAIAVITMSSSSAFASMSEMAQTQEVKQQVVMMPITPITSPVKTAEVISGPIKVSNLLQGPIVKYETPEMGSLEWLAEKKAEQDKVKSDAEKVQAELEAEIARLEKIARDTKNLNIAIAKTKKYVGKTWYALGGSTPDAWDCSGLVLWTYANLGIELRHSASAQKESGIFVDTPKIGDIVSFTYKGSTNAFHTAIYTGPDEMLHSGGKKGDRTEITSISRWSKGNGDAVIRYTRIVETNN